MLALHVSPIFLPQHPGRGDCYIALQHRLRFESGFASKDISQ
jgi:hypothetical protein